MDKKNDIRPLLWSHMEDLGHKCVIPPDGGIVTRTIQHTVCRCESRCSAVCDMEMELRGSTDEPYTLKEVEKVLRLAGWVKKKDTGRWICGSCNKKLRSR